MIHSQNSCRCDVLRTRHGELFRTWPINLSRLLQSRFRLYFLIWITQRQAKNDHKRFLGQNDHFSSPQPVNNGGNYERERDNLQRERHRIGRYVEIPPHLPLARKWIRERNRATVKARRIPWTLSHSSNKSSDAVEEIYQHFPQLGELLFYEKEWPTANFSQLSERSGRLPNPLENAVPERGEF